MFAHTSTETFGTFHVNARFQATPAAPRLVEVTATYGTPDEATAAAAELPRSCRAFATSMSSDGHRYGLVRMQVELSPSDARGAVNEAGVKRYASLMRRVAKLGHPVAEDVREDGGRDADQYESLAAFHQAIGL